VHSGGGLPFETLAGLIGGVGRVTAPDQEAAIAKAVEEFKIDPAPRFRLIAEPAE